MALTKGTNSYATVAEADTHFEGRLDAAAWELADEDRKGQALITATSVFDYMDWGGVAVSESQNLAFPRVGTYFDPRLGTEVDFGSGTPERIMTGTFELAYHLLNNDGLLDDTGSAIDIVVGPISLKRISGANQIPSNVKRLIKPLLVNAGANMWWRAN